LGSTRTRSITSLRPTVDRVFLDSNVVVSAALLANSKFRRLWELEDAVLLTSDYVLDEVVRNVQRPEHKSALLALRSKLVLVTQWHRELSNAGGIVAKDRAILAAAIAGSATHLLTGDKRHFGHLYGRSVAGVLVLSPGDYLAARATREAERGGR